MLCKQEDIYFEPPAHVKSAGVNKHKVLKNLKPPFKSYFKLQSCYELNRLSIILCHFCNIFCEIETRPACSIPNVATPQLYTRALQCGLFYFQFHYGNAAI